MMTAIGEPLARGDFLKKCPTIFVMTTATFSLENVNVGARPLSKALGP
jgi:hypothetical protein